MRALRESPSWSERLNAIAIAVEVFGCHNVVVMQALRWGRVDAGDCLLAPPCTTWLLPSCATPLLVPQQQTHDSGGAARPGGCWWLQAAAAVRHLRVRALPCPRHHP
eukprot:COSAG01_NODE_37797_length_498_cov_3.766917_1_plen_106_part_01